MDGSGGAQAFGARPATAQMRETARLVSELAREPDVRFGGGVAGSEAAFLLR